MNISQAGVDLIKSYEGCRLSAYLDAVSIPTIGYGHTGPEVELGQTISQDEADVLLLQDLQRFCQGVDRLAPGATQNQFDALVSFAYNLGLGSLQSSTLLRKYLTNDVAGAADEFLKWDKAAGKVLLGLAKRRAAERALFLGLDHVA
jgi:lysozyme